MNTDYPIGIEASGALKPRIKYIEQRDVTRQDKVCRSKTEENYDECRIRRASCLRVTI